MNDNDLGNFKSAYAHMRSEIEALMETDDMATLEELCPPATEPLA